MQIISGKQLTPVSALFYGPEGVGKSSLAAQLPKPLFIDVESGTSELDVQRTPRPQSWAALKGIVADLIQNPMGYETLVIDTADWAERLGIQQVCTTNGYSGMGGNSDYGKSYAQLADLWSELLNMIQDGLIDRHRMHVVFLAHSTTKKHELPEEAGQYDRYQLAMEKKVAALLREWAKMVIFINYKTLVNIDEKKKTAHAVGGTRRVMYAEHTAAFDAKNRHGLPAEMDLGFAPLAHCFYPLAPAPVAAPAPAPAPVAAAPVATEIPAQNLNPAMQLGTPPEIGPAHRQFQQLMDQAGVTYDQVLAFVAGRGKIAHGTPFERMPEEFINTYIQAFWAPIVDGIKNPKPAAAAAETAA